MGQFAQLWQAYGAAFLNGTLVTVKLTVFALALGIALGMVVCAGRLTKNRFVYGITSIYVEVVRSTPVTVELFFVYYSLPEWGIVIRGFWAAVLTLGLFYATIYAEIYRSGIQSVDAGQREAAQALGLTPRTTMRKVIIPQSLMAILPPATSAAVDLIKDTALVVTIGVAELMYQAYQAGSDTFLYMDSFILAGVIYFIVCYCLSLAARRWERRAQRSSA